MNRIYQALSDAGLKSYGWDGFGYKDYSMRFSNFSRNLNNIKANLETYSGGLFAAGTWLSFLDGTLAKGRGNLCFNYHGAFSQHIGFSSLDGKANYIIMLYNRNIVPFYPRGVAALCNVNYNSSNQDQYDLSELYRELDINDHLNIKRPYEVLAESGFSVSRWNGHTDRSCDYWTHIDAKLCGDRKNPIYVEIENCLTKVINNTIMQGQLICNENEPRSGMTDYLIYAVPLVTTCAAGYLAYSFFRNRNAAPAQVAIPVVAPVLPPGQEDNAPRHP